jgi:hypothetical protein
MCSITVGFIPQAGKKYRSYLTVDPSVTKCDVTLEDITFANPLEVSTFYVNENLCLGGKDMGPISGKPERLRWRVHVILIPQ